MFFNPQRLKFMRNIQMVDLQAQYTEIETEVQQALHESLRRGDFINGAYTRSFAQRLGEYLGSTHCIPCANGTDALQIALMAAGLERGAEIIVPAFTYVATVEVIALLGFCPLPVDVCKDTFNIDLEAAKRALTPRTRAIVPVHLFGQCCDMEPLLAWAKTHNLFVIEDNAQAIGSRYTFSDGSQRAAGTLGRVGCTSFYPSKNLGAYGDGGAMFAQDADTAALLQKIANHGQGQRYYHDIIGVNSRLDNLQAAILQIKLARLDAYTSARQRAADLYDALLAPLAEAGVLSLPFRAPYSTHVFHQYTLTLRDAAQRESLQQHLQKSGIPSMIYYPVPLQEQRAYADLLPAGFDAATLPNTNYLCARVLSLPMHSHLDEEQQTHICAQIRSFFAL